MNIRLAAGQVRIRLDKDEAIAVLETGSAAWELKLTNELNLSLHLTAAETGEPLDLAASGGRLDCRVSRSALEALLEAGPAGDAALCCQVGPELSYCLEIDKFTFKKKRSPFNPTRLTEDGFRGIFCKKT